MQLEIKFKNGSTLVVSDGTDDPMRHTDDAGALVVEECGRLGLDTYEVESIIEI